MRRKYAGGSEKMGRGPTLAFHISVDIVMARARVRVFVVSDIINFVFLEESFIDYPWCFGNDLIYPPTMASSF